MTDIVQKRSGVSSTLTAVSEKYTLTESSENRARDVVFLAENDIAVAGGDMEASAFEAQAASPDNGDVTK